MEPKDDEPPISEADWKQDLLAACAEAIAHLPDEPSSAVAVQPAEESPGLYSFYEELVVLRNEVRTGNRRAAETFAKFGEVLESMREDSGKLRERLANPGGAESSQGTTRRFALNLVDFIDRADRLETAARAQAVRGWLARLRSGDGWVQQAEAISILHEHLQQLLAKSGIERVEAAPGTPFDPHFMKSVGRDAPGRIDGTAIVVSEELLPGYRLGDQCLRPAEVRVTSSSPSHE
jgi:molecular chaperone GrpE (heat shock protein)